MIGILKPAAHKPLLPADKIDPTYRRLRWQVFAGIFFGYAAYYFVRGNFDLAQKGLNWVRSVLLRVWPTVSRSS